LRSAAIKRIVRCRALAKLIVHDIKISGCWLIEYQVFPVVSVLVFTTQRINRSIFQWPRDMRAMAGDPAMAVC
jgi:hypothetical protein